MTDGCRQEDCFFPIWPPFSVEACFEANNFWYNAGLNQYPSADHYCPKIPTHLPRSRSIWHPSSPYEELGLMEGLKNTDTGEYLPGTGFRKLTEVHRILPKFTKVYWSLPKFTVSYQKLLGSLAWATGSLPLSNRKFTVRNRKLTSKLPVCHGKLLVCHGKLPVCHGKILVYHGKILVSHGNTCFIIIVTTL